MPLVLPKYKTADHWLPQPQRARKKAKRTLKVVERAAPQRHYGGTETEGGRTRADLFRTPASKPAGELVHRSHGTVPFGYDAYR